MGDAAIDFARQIRTELSDAAPAGFLFNDSGVVVALFLMGTFLATGVYLLFLDGSPLRVTPTESGTLKSSSVEC